MVVSVFLTGLSTHRDLNFKWNLNELKTNLSHSPIPALEIPSGRLRFLATEDLVAY